MILPNSVLYSVSHVMCIMVQFQSKKCDIGNAVTSIDVQCTVVQD